MVLVYLPPHFFHTNSPEKKWVAMAIPIRHHYVMREWTRPCQVTSAPQVRVSGLASIEPFVPTFRARKKLQETKNPWSFPPCGFVLPVKNVNSSHTLNSKIGFVHFCILHVLIGEFKGCQFVWKQTASVCFSSFQAIAMDFWSWEMDWFLTLREFVVLGMQQPWDAGLPPKCTPFFGVGIYWV